MKVAIIPARAGSKRVKLKNIRSFAGRPMITYPIEAALKSKLFDRVIVSTESSEIAEIAREAGAEVPFLRPEDLAGDQPTTTPVVIHALEWLAQQGHKPDLACLIYATAAFLTPEFLSQGLKLMNERGADSTAAVTQYSHPIDRALTMPQDGFLKFRWPENKNVRTNDLPPSYHDLGMFYWLRVARFLATKSVWQEKTSPVLIPSHLAADIDTEEDWQRAELLFERLAR